SAGGGRMRMAWGGVALVVGGLALAQTAGKTGTHKVVTPDQIKWGPPPAGVPPSAEIAVLDGNPAENGLYILRFPLPDGTKTKPHWHTKDEKLTVISGKFSMGMGEKWDEAQMKELAPGTFFTMPGGMRHYAQAHGETVVQLSNMGPFDIFYVNPSDDPRG